MFLRGMARLLGIYFSPSQNHGINSINGAVDKRGRRNNPKRSSLAQSKVEDKAEALFGHKSNASPTKSLVLSTEGPIQSTTLVHTKEKPYITPKTLQWNFQHNFPLRVINLQTFLSFPAKAFTQALGVSKAGLLIIRKYNCKT